MKSYLQIVVLICFAVKLTAQENLSDTLPQALKVVEVNAARLTLTDIKAPLAVTVLSKNRLQTATQQLTPYEVLSAVPGVFVMNPDNFSQDLRISIRGFGARAAFGIRGIRLFTDGLPEGTPDGQADVDNLDMGIIRQMEILRGAASGMYGNASGGVIYMTTENPTARRPLLEGQLSAGSFGFRRYQLKIGQNFGKILYFLNGSYNTTTGYRQWSDMQNTILNGKTAYYFNPNTKLTLLFNYGNSPKANDPGGLTAQQVIDNPKQAGANNLLFETGESVNQSRIGATFESRMAEKHTVQARLFYTSRHLVNRLAVAANGFGDLQRQYGGGGVSYQFDYKKTISYRVKIGLDIENQEDTRMRFSYRRENIGSVAKYYQDKMVLNQLETFKSVGAYILQDIEPIKNLLLSFCIRYDDLTLKATDKYLTDGDQSGNRDLSKINPNVGFNYSIFKNASVYGNYSSTFESPTLNELSNNPNNTGGFNPTLEPQQAQSFEIGSKGRVTEGVRYDIALYKINTTNDLVPFQITGQTGKTFYRNAGKTARNGFEMGLEINALRHVTWLVTYTYSDFKYKTYSVNSTVYDGKILPGIPKNNLWTELRYIHPKGFFGILQWRNVGKVYANDSNAALADGYNLLNIRLGYTFNTKQAQIEPFLAVNNLFKQDYIANVQINAANDRYFEPAALQYIYGGLKVRLSEK